jgi:hypothetical protein
VNTSTGTQRIKQGNETVKEAHSSRKTITFCRPWAYDGRATWYPLASVQSPGGHIDAKECVAQECAPTVNDVDANRNASAKLRKGDREEGKAFVYVSNQTGATEAAC